MARLKGSKNIKPSKQDLYNELSNIDQKALPPSFGKLDALVIAPKTISNNPIELIKLNKGFVGICNLRNSTAIASTPLRLYAITNYKNEKLVFPHKSLNKKYIDTLKAETKSTKVKQASNIVEITEHPIFSCLNNINNGDLNYYDGIELTSSYLGIIGNAFWQIIKDNSGLPTGIEILPSEYTTIMLNDDMTTKGYRLHNGIFQKEYNKDEIIHFKNVSPGLFWRVFNNALKTGLYGMGDAEYCLDEIYLYNSINDYLRSLTENNSIPTGIVKYTGGKLDKNTMEDVQRQWDKTLRTWKRSGKTKVMDQDFEWIPLGMAPKDLDFAEGFKRLRGVIANCFGVPEELLASENANRASANVAISNYFRFTVLPKLKRLEERLNSHLCPLFDDNLFVTFDNPTPNDETLQLSKEKQDLELGVITINEVRKSRGLEPVEWGNVPRQSKPTVTNNSLGNSVDPSGINEEESNANDGK